IGTEAVLLTDSEVRSRVVDFLRKEVTFLNKSKGGTLYAFGGFKKVTSAITVSLIWDSIGPKFKAYPTVEQILKKNMLGEDELQGWKDEVQACEEFRGMEGLLNFNSIVNYASEAGGKIHPRQALILKKFDAGSFLNLKENPPPIE